VQDLAALDPTQIGHLRLWGCMSPQLRPVIPHRRIAGTAVTVLVPTIDSALIPYVMGTVRPGDIVVIDRLGDDKYSCLGATIALAAKCAGVAGIIVDGVATDFDEIREIGLPVWCRGQAALTTKLLALGGAINVPVSCGGVAVLPGDAILADDSGICVLRPGEVRPIIDAVRSRPPAGRAERLLAGEKLPDINGVRQLVEHKLQAQDDKRKPR
jgi:regulator of RNase E activity RraA